MVEQVFTYKGSKQFRLQARSRGRRRRATLALLTLPSLCQHWMHIEDILFFIFMVIGEEGRETVEFSIKDEVRSTHNTLSESLKRVKRQKPEDSRTRWSRLPEPVTSTWSATMLRELPPH